MCDHRQTTSQNNSKMSALDSNYELLIRPNRRWLVVDWCEMYQYRGLLWQFVHRDFTSRFKQTLLGPLWFVINPLITTVVFAIIFGRVLGASPEGVPALLFFNAGLLAWNYFAGVLSSTGNTLQGNIHLFGKVYFPRLIVPLAQVVSNLLAFVVQLLTFGLLVMYVQNTDPNFANLHFGYRLLWLPILTVHIAVLALGGGLVLSAMTAKYRDMQNAVSFIVSSLMFVTPIMWPLSMLQVKFPQYYEIFVLLNPLIGIVEAFRLVLIGVGSFSLGYYAISIGISVVILLVGIALFQRAARSFVDHA